MGNLGATELIIIVLIVLIFFGSKKIPELAAGLGKGMREFRKATRDIQEDQGESVAELKDPRTETTTCFYCGSRVSKDARFCPTSANRSKLPAAPSATRSTRSGPSSAWSAERSSDADSRAVLMSLIPGPPGGRIAAGRARPFFSRD